MSTYWNNRGGYQSSNRHYPKKPSKLFSAVSSVPSPPLGKLIKSLHKIDLENDAKGYLNNASIKDCSLVASYNWLNKANSTIVIPGKYLT